MPHRLLTVAIHTYSRAMQLKAMLESEGIRVTLQNINLDSPTVSPGVRVRISEADLALALRIIEHTEIFVADNAPVNFASHSIVVPVDGSETSFNACRAAFAIAQRKNVDIVLIHAYIDPYLAGNIQLTDALNFDLGVDTEARRHVRQSARMQLARFVERLNKAVADGELPDVTVTTHIAEGVPEDVILQYAKTDPPYLAVMGTRGSKQKLAEMLGSVTAEVIDKIPYSVLAIPEPFTIPTHPLEYSPKHAMVLVNLEQEDILVIDTMTRIFAHTDTSPVKVTLVRKPSRKMPYAKTVATAMDNLCSYCNKNFKGFKFEASDIDISRNYENLPHFVTQNNIDLVVAPNKRQNALVRLLNSTTANRLLFSCDIPMLIIKT